jgi:hypothetical protein
MNVKFAKVYMFHPGHIKDILILIIVIRNLQNIGLQPFIKKQKKIEEKCLWKPKAKIIKEKIDFFSLRTDTIIDIGGGYGTFIEEFLKILKY